MGSIPGGCSAATRGEQRLRPRGGTGKGQPWPPLTAVCWAVQAQNKAEENKTKLQTTTDAAGIPPARFNPCCCDQQPGGTADSVGRSISYTKTIISIK